MKMREVIAAGLLFVLIFPVHAVTVYQVDFNTVRAGSAAGWNAYADPAAVTGTLSDTNGSSAAGVTIAVSGVIYDSSGTWTATNTSPSWVSLAAGGDFFWTESSTTIIRGQTNSFTVTFDGMTAGSTVSLDVFAARSSSYNLTAYYEYSLDGGSSWSGLSVLDRTGVATGTDTQSQVFNLSSDGLTAGRYMSTMDVTLSGSSLMLRLSEDELCDYAGINAMRLTTPEFTGVVTNPPPVITTNSLQVYNADFSGSITAGSPEIITGDAVLTGLTTEEGTFTNLVGATAFAVVTANSLNSIGTAPATADESLTGLTVNDGVNNMTSGYFQFPNGFDEDTRFFIMETTPLTSTLGDAVTVTFVDAGNVDLPGTYSLSLTAGDFTASAAGTTTSALATVTYTMTAATPAQKQGATWFSPADFTGTGDLSKATGIRVTSAGLDPVVVGIYSISGTFPPAPEPSVPGISVLFVGNSYTHGGSSYDVLRNYNSAAITDLNGTGYGGVAAMFKQMTVEAGLNYDVYIEAVSSQTLTYHLTSKSNLIFQAWDHVMLQEHSLGALPANLATFQSAAVALEQGIHAANATAKVYLYETYPRADQVYESGGLYYGGTVEDMIDDLHNGYYSVPLLDPNFTAVSPAGDAWRSAIQSGVGDRNPYDGIDAGKVDLWAVDHYHASAYGCYLNTLVHFGTITGLDPRTLGYEKVASDLGIASNVAVSLQQTAFNTLTNNGAKPVVTLTGDADYTVEAASTYIDPGASAKDVLDGGITPAIVYNEVIADQPGTYTVVWQAVNSQGLTGTAVRVVHVIPSSKPSLSAGMNTPGSLMLGISNLSSGQTVVIERKLNLTDASWTTVHSFTVTGTETNYLPAMTNQQAFYRVFVQ